MIRIQSDPDTLALVKQRLTQQHPNLQFSGNLRLGRLEIELNKETAEFITTIIHEVRQRRQKPIEVQIERQRAAQSGISREFLNGYFRRR